MPSFDIVSEVNQVEVRNALDQANKEISTRFDFKGSDSRVEYDGKALTLYADDEFKLGQVTDVLSAKFAKRQVDSRSLKDGDIEKISGNKVKRVVTVRTGVEQETAKKIVKLLKESKIKVQGSIQGDRCASPAPSATTCRRRSRWSRAPSPTTRCNTRTSAIERARDPGGGDRDAATRSRAPSPRARRDLLRLVRRPVALPLHRPADARGRVGTARALRGLAPGQRQPRRGLAQLDRVRARVGSRRGLVPGDGAVADGEADIAYLVFGRSSVAASRAKRCGRWPGGCSTRPRSTLIVAQTDERNEASRRAALAAGFVADPQPFASTLRGEPSTDRVYRLRPAGAAGAAAG